MGFRIIMENAKYHERRRISLLICDLPNKFQVALICIWNSIMRLDSFSWSFLVITSYYLLHQETSTSCGLVYQTLIRDLKIWIFNSPEYTLILHCTINLSLRKLLWTKVLFLVFNRIPSFGVTLLAITVTCSSHEILVDIELQIHKW